MCLPTEIISQIRIIPVGITLAVIAMISAIAGCTDITEYSQSYQAGLTVLSPEDFSEVGSVSGLVSPRCMLVYPGNLFVLSTEGILYRIDTETLEITSELELGTPSAAGYSEIVFSENQSAAYLIGAHGNIMEVSLPDCEIIDQFTVGTSPVALAVTSGHPGYLWVADAAENSIHQIKLGDNEDYYTLNYPPEYSFRCMEASCYPDSLLVGTSILVSRVEALGPGSIRSGFILHTNVQGMSDMVRIPNDSNFVAVTAQENQIGELCAYDRNTYPMPPNRYYNIDGVEGSGFILAAANDNRHVYALASLGDGTSRLYRYSYIYPFGINKYVDLPGYPLDMEVSGTGMIYILTFM